MKSTASRNSVKSEIVVPQFIEFKEEIIEDFYLGNHRRYYGVKEAFLSMFMCWRIKKSYGLIKDTLEKTRRFIKDFQIFEKETDIIKIISGMFTLTNEQKSNNSSIILPVLNVWLKWFKPIMQRTTQSKKRKMMEGKFKFAWWRLSKLFTLIHNFKYCNSWEPQFKLNQINLSFENSLYAIMIF